MGWSYGYQSRKALIDSVLRDFKTSTQETRCLAKCSVGFTSVWAVMERRMFPQADEAGTVSRFVVLLMIRRHGDWGYKDVDASMGPTEVSCPLKYLDMVTTDTLGTYGPEWVKRVRKYHAQRGRGKKLEVGMEVPLKKNSANIERATLTSLRPLTASAGWMSFKMKRTLIDFEKMT